MSKSGTGSARKKVRKLGVKIPRKTRAPLVGNLQPHERPIRKNHYLYQSKLDLAKEILGVSTETEALDTALDLLIYGEALAQGTEAMAGEKYHDLMDISCEIPTAGEEN